MKIPEKIQNRINRVNELLEIYKVDEVWKNQVSSGGNSNQPNWGFKYLRDVVKYDKEIQLIDTGTYDPILEQEALARYHDFVKQRQDKDKKQGKN